MKSFLTHKNFRFYFYTAWLLLNCFQAQFTELFHDEAYYWIYAKFLDLGYFDHPPMVAVFIKLGYFVFKNEFGVRLIAILANLGTILLIEKIIQPTKFTLFATIVSSIAIIQLGGFLIVPDNPLIFFIALFFYFYKRFLENVSWANSILLGLSVALMLYSKYHAILVIFFTLLANLKLLKSKHFYLVIFIATFAYFPHIWWQISNDYPSYFFHVLNKSQEAYQWQDTINYLLGQLAISGPIIGFFLFYGLFKFKSSSVFEKTLKFNGIGIFLFFLFSTLNAAVEPNWTVPLFIPLIAIGYWYYENKSSSRKWIATFAICSFIIFLPARIYLMVDFLPETLKRETEFHGWKKWAKTIEKKAGDLPVAFMNSYQKAAKYSFYSGKIGFSYNNIRYRKNQYDLWEIEKELQGEKVFFVPNWEVGHLPKFETEKGAYSYLIFDDFTTYGNSISIKTESKKLKFPASTIVDVPLIFENLSPNSISFSDENFPVALTYQITLYQQIIENKEVFLFPKDTRIENTLLKTISLKTPAEKGKYFIRFSLKQGWLPPELTSRLIVLEIV